MNNNKTDEAALLGRTKGVFSKTAYITIGTKDAPELYGMKEKLRSNYTGKQFHASNTKTGKTPDTFFEKKHTYIFEGDKFIDRSRYAEIQKEKHKGFLTGDFHRRDEFSNTIRTEQWREQLQQEKKFSNLAINGAPKTTGEDEKLTEIGKPQQNEIFLYDRVFETDNLKNHVANHTHNGANESRRTGSQRNMRGIRTTYHLTHTAPTSFEKPEYARKPIVRDTFYRKRNVPLAQY